MYIYIYISACIRFIHGVVEAVGMIDEIEGEQEGHPKRCASLSLIKNLSQHSIIVIILDHLL